MYIQKDSEHDGLVIAVQTEDARYEIRMTSIPDHWFFVTITWTPPSSRRKRSGGEAPSGSGILFFSSFL